MHLLKVAGSGPNRISLKCLEMSVRSLQDWGKHKWEKRGKKKTQRIIITQIWDFFFSLLKTQYFLLGNLFMAGITFGSYKEKYFPK